MTEKELGAFANYSPAHDPLIPGAPQSPKFLLQPYFDALADIYTGNEANKDRGIELLRKSLTGNPLRDLAFKSLLDFRVNQKSQGLFLFDNCKVYRIPEGNTDFDDVVPGLTIKIVIAQKVNLGELIENRNMKEMKCIGKSTDFSLVGGFSRKGCYSQLMIHRDISEGEYQKLLNLPRGPQRNMPSNLKVSKSLKTKPIVLPNPNDNYILRTGKWINTVKSNETVNRVLNMSLIDAKERLMIENQRP